MLLLDCKNKKPLVYPSASADLQPDLVSVKATEDILGAHKEKPRGCYNHWELYAITKRVEEVETELTKLRARMMWVLTGRGEYIKEMKVLGG